MPSMAVLHTSADIALSRREKQTAWAVQSCMPQLTLHSSADMSNRQTPQLTVHRLAVWHTSADIVQISR